MRVFSISANVFKAGKIELTDINKQDIINYDSIQTLAKKKFCDFHIKKKTDMKYIPDDNVYTVLARRKWIKPNYIFGISSTTIPKNASKQEVAQCIMETSIKAANTVKEKICDLAKAFIGTR